MTKASQSSIDGAKRRRQSVPVARLLQRLLTPAARQQGFAETAVLADWPEIIGTEMAKRCQPLKVTRARGQKGGTLVVQASPIMTLELQHAAPQIIQRINTYFGYPAIARMRLVAGHVRPPKSQKAAKTKPLSIAQKAHLVDTTSGIEAEPLKQALSDLGRAIMTRVRP